jgi:hypothetical protein
MSAAADMRLRQRHSSRRGAPLPRAVRATLRQRAPKSEPALAVAQSLWFSDLLYCDYDTEAV